MRRITSWALRAGWRRGILGGSRPWLAVGGVAVVARMLSASLKRTEKVVYQQELPAGVTISIENRPRR